MPLNLPESASSVAARSKADVQRELAQSNPFGKNHWLGAIVTGAANRIYDFYLQLKAALRDSIPDTAQGDALTRWAAIWGKQLKPALKSSGNIVATGLAGSSIPLATVFTTDGNGNFVSTSSATISAQIINILSLSRSGTTVTAVTESNHGLANNVSVVIAGAASPDYNVTTAIVVTALNAFQYQIVGTPVDEPATNATASFTSASIPVESEDLGAATIISAGTLLILQSPIVGVDDTLAADFGGVTGGADQETETELRERLLYRIQNPVAQFNVSAITEAAMNVPGVHRVFVEEVTPLVGQVTVYFTTADGPIPSAATVALVNTEIQDIRPANTDVADVFVLAPTAVVINFTFSTISPDTPTMRQAIIDNLQQMFDERVDVGSDVTADAFRSAIYNTVDTVTGQSVSSFTLASPAAGVAIAAGELGVLGAVVFQ